jgi:tetratricopeptide (TPR) repeat protein
MRGRLDDATTEQYAITALKYPDNPMWAERRPLMDVMANQLAGVIAFARGDKPLAIAELEKAVAAEDKLDPSGEPPDWNVPSRHILGMALLAADRAFDAEQVYRKDLEILPETGWSLVGLANALRAQKSPDADSVQARFVKAWDGADVKTTSSTLTP